MHFQLLAFILPALALAAPSASTNSKCPNGKRDCWTPPSPPPVCEQCVPWPELNKCHDTTSCIWYTDHKPEIVYYCACRAGYKSADSTQNFRLEFAGQEYRVFVNPGVVCDTPCDSQYPGPESCQEVPVCENCL